MTTFILLMLVTTGLSLWAAARVKSVYHRYSRVPVATGATGAETAARILRHAGIYDVEITHQDGMLGDHYDPLHKRLVLSTQNYYGNSAAAVGVAAHECGHAIQHQRAYAPLQWRMAAVGVTTYANQMVMWLPLLGMFTGLIQPYVAFTIVAACWGIIMLFNLITLPVEFDASRRAKLLLGNTGIVMPGEEATGVSRVLNAAAWTYVAAFITSLGYFLYYLLPLLGGRDRE